MRILCIGDSNTWGYNPRNGMQHSRRWTKILADLMPENEIIEDGMCGRTFLSMDSDIPQRCGVDTLPEIIQHNQSVDFVIVMNGTNELKIEFDRSRKYLEEGVETFIKMLQNPYSWKENCVPKLLMVSPILIREEVLYKGGICEAFDEESVRLSNCMADIVSKMCEQYDVEFMDAAQYAEASLVDAIHMDEENHEKLGKAIYEKVKQIVK